MSFRLVPKSVTLKDLEQLPGALRKSSRSLSHLLMSSCNDSAQCYWTIGRSLLSVHPVFSEHELMFTFAICCRPSVVCRLSVVCLSVCNARALYSDGCKFKQFCYGIWYL